MLIGILGMGSIGDRHALNCMRLGHQVIYYDPLREGSLTREQVIGLADAVLICTPTKQHIPDLRDVLSAKKHLFVEKPIGWSHPAYIKHLIKCVKAVKPDLVVATGFMLRFHPEIIKAKKIIAAKQALGRPIAAAAFVVRQRNDKPDYLRDGVIRNWLSHEIDLARHLLGDLEVKESRFDNPDTLGSILLSTIERATQVIIAGDYETHPEERGFMVGFQDEKMADLVVDLVSPPEVWDQVYLDELQAFINACQGLDAGPLADGADGVAALQIVMDARQKAGLDD